MPVLDALRTTLTDATIGPTPSVSLIVPPFHTGVLGFIPAVQQVSIYRPPDGTEATELYITPFRNSMERMFHLEVHLLNRPGVVNRLLEALADLNINVIKQESCSINAGEIHFFDLVLEWSSGGSIPWLASPTPTGPSDRSAYEDMTVRLNVLDARYVLLYEQIMRRCSGDLWFDFAWGRRLPAITARPFSKRHLSHLADTTIVRKIDPSVLEPRLGAIPPIRNSVALNLSTDTVQMLRAGTGQTGAELQYLLSADGMSRTLRAYFPKQTELDRLVHIGFRSKDETGVLAALSRLIRVADYDIVTSLLRHDYVEHERNSIWEVIVAGRSGSATGRHESHLVRKQQFAEGMRKAAALDPAATLACVSAKVRIVDPTFPPVPTSESIGELIIADRYPACVPPQKTLQRYGKTVPRPPGSPSGKPHEQYRARADRNRALDVVRKTSVRVKPTVFVSYSVGGRRIGQYIMKDRALCGMVELVDYQGQEGTYKKSEAIERILASDFVICVWAYDRKRPGEYRAIVSPWLAFEYGVASATGRLTAHCVSAQLHASEGPGRIHSDYIAISYSRNLVKSTANSKETPIQIVRRQVRKWVEEHPPSHVPTAGAGGGRGAA